MKTEKPSDKKSNKDFLDHLDDFIEENIERHFRKGLEEVEGFVRKEILKEKEGKKKSKAFSYIEAFLNDPKVASVAPSTKFVVDRILKMIDWHHTRMIIEYGPAEGVITRQLLKHLPQNGQIIAVELNEGFAKSLSSKTEDPRLHVIQGSVVEIDKLVAPLGVAQADVIISGIPFSFLKPIERHQLLHKTEDLLRPGGRFIAYQFTAHLISLMKYHFEKVDVQFEIRNIPPHFVFTGFKGGVRA